MSTAVLLELDTHARVVGEGSAYLLQLKRPSSVLEPGKPADVSGIEVFAVPAGKDFLFTRRRTIKTRYLNS
jgi:hypothetical protein